MHIYIGGGAGSDGKEKTHMVVVGGVLRQVGGWPDQPPLPSISPVLPIDPRDGVPVCEGVPSPGVQFNRRRRREESSQRGWVIYFVFLNRGWMYVNVDGMKNEY